MVTYEQRGFSPQDFAEYHPGGRLGRKLLQVGTLMHRDDELPVVTENASMAQAVQEINGKGLGMTCVVDGDGRLVGDVDFAAARKVAGAITPVPGGIGPMTIACLLANTVTAACRSRGLPDPRF